jgi:TolA-binding protein
LEQGSKSAPQVSSPGCLFGNPVTGSIARAFLGDEAQYKVGLYRYQNGDYQGAIDAFTRVHQDYPQSPLRGSAYYWEGESYYRLGQYDKALVAYQQIIQHFPGERLRDYALLAAADVQLRVQRPAMPFHSGAATGHVSEEFDEPQARRYLAGPFSWRAVCEAADA